MRPISCPKCQNVVDADSAPVKTSEQPGTKDLRSSKQEDITCPKCGGLILRKLNGEEVGGEGADPRAAVAPTKAPKK